MERRRLALIALVSAILLASCVGGDFVPGSDGALIDDGRVIKSGTPDGLAGDLGPILGTTLVYAHSADTLYRLNPSTLKLSKVGAFVWPGSADTMTDLAIDRYGDLIGVSFNSIYRVDPQNARCTRLAQIAVDFNGLSFLPGSDGEILVGVTQDGIVYRIDKLTGAAQQIGAYGAGIPSSGDIVSVRGFGTVATVTRPLISDHDWLARIDESTGKASLIGDIGYSGIWGLGFWRGKVYGFSTHKQALEIDVNSGRGTPIPDAFGIDFWGAAVTTSAPIE